MALGNHDYGSSGTNIFPEDEKSTAQVECTAHTVQSGRRRTTATPSNTVSGLLCPRYQRQRDGDVMTGVVFDDEAQLDFEQVVIR